MMILGFEWWLIGSVAVIAVIAFGVGWASMPLIRQFEAEKALMLKKQGEKK